MPSDERVAAALSGVGPHIAAFRHAVAGTLERARNTLAADSGPGQTRTALGDFAAGRIDPDRFAMISSGAGPLDAMGRAVLQHAIDALEFLLNAGDQQFVVEVPHAGSAATAISARMQTIGSAFSASATVERVRRRTYDQAQRDAALLEYPFEKWTVAERKLAPPLVVRLDGSDLDPFELAPFIDGRVCLLLLVEEPCAPAPLARLISPGVFVAQTDDAKIVEALTELDAPAVIAVMKGPGARFVHDPRTRGGMWQRLHVTTMPDISPRKSLGLRSSWQQREDLTHLKALMEPPVLSAITDGVLATGDGKANPADRLTAWLIGQAGFQGDKA
jgi:hypothetical protein